jgi:DNA modification methylase
MSRHTDRLEIISIDKLIPYANNARTHSDEQIKKIQASLREFGFVNPVLIDKDCGIIAGHARVEAAKREGLTEVPCVWVEHLTEAQKKAYILADNRLAEDAGWDFELLSVELEELKELDFDIGLTGFGADELSDIFGEEETEVAEDNYEVELPEEPKAKLGDIYQLGNHRLMCGDSTDNEMVDKLMGGVVADICFTSPPYNVGSLNIDGIEGTRPKYNSYDDNKTGEEYYNFISTNVKLMLENAKEVFYNIGLVENNKRQIILLLNEFIAQFKDIIYWKKSTVAPHIQSGIINNLVEFILCFGNGKRKFENAQFSQGTYWNVIEGPSASGNKYSNIHKATFPIYLPSNIIENFSPKNGTVIDCFGGTGTTLIACEQLNRTCYMMELDPKYCDVIINRWSALTGLEAQLL